MFTAEQAFEATENGDPIRIDEDFAIQILIDHGASIEDFYLDNHGQYLNSFDKGIDSAVLLAWLGY